MKPANSMIGQSWGVGLSLKQDLSYGPTIACITAHQVGLEKHSTLIASRTDGA
jgi:hypothetical protein